MNILCVLFVSLLYSGASLAATPHDDIYNPIAVGLRWVADVTITTPDGRSIQGTATREITGTETINGKTYFTSYTTVTGIPAFKPFTTYRRKGPEGEFAISASDLKKQEHLDTPYPLAVGKTWEVPSNQGKILFRVEAFEPVTVAGTRYDNCFKLSYRSDTTEYSSVFYLAPHVGNVTETMKVGGSTLVFSHRTLTTGK